MSAVYKTIARARDIAKILIKDYSWNDSGVQSEMDVAWKLYKDIMEQDPVSINIFAPSIKKLKAFIAKHEAVLDKEPTPPGVHTKKEKDPFSPPVPKKKEPRETIHPPAQGEDPLTKLDNLVKEFSDRGYKLETRIVKIHQES